jgi:hypothetical protein
VHGYQSYSLGQFRFVRDEYFAQIRWPSGSHTMDIGNFLRALMRDVAWGFFYGWVHFDDVFGTCNHYGTVDIFAGRYNGNYCRAKVDHLETHPTEQVRAVFTSMIEDWTNEGFDPFAAPQETGTAYGPKRGSNLDAVRRARSTATRCVGLAGDAPLRSDGSGHRVNRAFADVPQDEPEIEAEPGFENEVHAFNLFAYLSRSDVTWNPSFTSVVKHSFMCPTTEEHILPIVHGNDRVEWFFQMCDEIQWDIGTRDTAEPRARVLMKAGDIAAMPADCRHRGYSPKRSMLLVWENGSPQVVHEIQQGLSPLNPVQF